jgi:hypothetical protein
VELSASQIRCVNDRKLQVEDRVLASIAAGLNMSATFVDSVLYSSAALG